MYPTQYCLHASIATLFLILATLPAGTKSQYNDKIMVDPLTGRVRDIFCYQCNSGLHPDCLSLQANNTNSIYYKPCNKYTDYKGAKPFCRKIVQTIFDRDNMVRVIRKCGWERHVKHDCYQMSNDDHIETVCQCFHDGCNDAPRLSLAAPALSLALTLGLTLSYNLPLKL